MKDKYNDSVDVAAAIFEIVPANVASGDCGGGGGIGAVVFELIIDPGKSQKYLIFQITHAE